MIRGGRGDLLSNVSTLYCVEAVDKKSGGCATGVGQFVLQYHDLLTKKNHTNE
jgi:hypothetical protein